MPMRATMKCDIPGESRFEGHEDEIDIVSISWGGHQMTDMAIGSGLSVSSAMIEPIVINKNLDASSVDLAKASLSAKHLPDATITFFKDAGEDHLDYLTFELTDVVVGGYSLSGAGEGPLMETVTLYYNEIKMLYKKQGTDQASASEYDFKYKVAAGKAE